MPDPFVHLHVASGFSLQHGVSSPAALVERAAEHGMDTLALTDRDGLYGAVRFVKACLTAGLRPVLGVDLALRPSAPDLRDRTSPTRPRSPRTPARGGAFRDPRLPRATFLAGGRRGWAAVCRLVSATHLTGRRGEPICSLDLVAEHVAGEDVVVLLGPWSEVGAAVSAGRDDEAGASLTRWRAVLDTADLVVELVNHRREGRGPGSVGHAARMARLAQAARVPVVLSNEVRHAHRHDAVVADVLDAARRLVPLDRRHVDRGNAEGFLKSGKEMAAVAEEICRMAGWSPRAATGLLAATRTLAERCAVDPRRDLGLGEVHLPELEVVGGAAGVPASADAVLRTRCEAGIGRRYGSSPRQRIWKRLDDELVLIARLGYAPYFLTVGDVCDLVRARGIRLAARGSGAGSLVNHLLGVSGVDPLRHGLLMERFLSPLRRALPDVDIDVESARRPEVYEAILDRYGGERCVAVSMRETYRARHAIRDVGAALGMPPGETGAIAQALPHVRARDIRTALRELPELRSSGLGEARLGLLFALAERLDGLPRHVAMHPCGVILSDATLLDRTPVEASFAGFPMSQFDKDDVEDLGLLKLDVLGIRMQSAMAHAVAEIARVDGRVLDIDDPAHVPFDDERTFGLISSAQTLGCFQIESPGQRELVGRSGIESFDDIVADISLFRPGPVQSDMITPYLEAKQEWAMPAYPHDDLRPILQETRGVVVYHEQVIEIIAKVAGVGLAEADEARRALADPAGKAATRRWFLPRAMGRGYSRTVVDRVWAVLEAFGSFGFCKAHAAAFALPTYQSAWLKAHYPAHFLAGVLTHDPGMYPKRLILDDARRRGVAVLGLDVNASEPAFTVERLAEGTLGIRVALSEVAGISQAEVARVVAARPFHSLGDFWERAATSRPVAERLVVTGAFDGLHGIGETGTVSRRSALTRRDLLLQVAELDRRTRSIDRAANRGARGRGVAARAGEPAADVRVAEATRRNGVWAQSSAQSRTSRTPATVSSVQLCLDLDDVPADLLGGVPSGLPEMDPVERVRAELEVLGLDSSHHVMAAYRPFLAAVGATPSSALLDQRNRAEVWVAGAKVATQTPPIRSGRRVAFVTLDDSQGPVDATFFADVLGRCGPTLFHAWLLVVRGEVRRTGRRGVSLRATGCWELPALERRWRTEGLDPVRDLLVHDQRDGGAGAPTGEGAELRRVIVRSAGPPPSPHAAIEPEAEHGVARLWHSSPGSPGR